MRQRLAAIRTRFRKTSPQRVARHHDLLFREKAFHSLIRHADRAGTLGQQLVGDSRIGVLLLNHGRNPHPLRRPQHRAAGIPSETDDHIGPEVADGAPGLADAFEHLEGHRQVFKSKRRCKPATGRPTIRYPNAGTFSISILPSAPTKRISTSSPKRRRSASATATAG